VATAGAAPHVALSSACRRFGRSYGLLFQLSTSRPSFRQPLPCRSGVGIGRYTRHLTTFLGMLLEGFAVAHCVGSSTLTHSNNMECPSQVPHSAEPNNNAGKPEELVRPVGSLNPWLRGLPPSKHPAG